MTTWERIVSKVTSVTAICTFILVAVLCYLTILNETMWKEIYSNVLMAFVGYYIGRYRSENNKSKDKDPKETIV